MRILIIVHRFPETGGAGAENYTRYLCDALSARHEIHVVTRHDTLSGDYCDSVVLEGFNYPVTAFLRHRRDSDCLEKNYWNPDLDAPFLEIVKKFHPDLIHFQHCIDLSASLIKCAADVNIPVFFTLHDFWFVCPGIVMLDESNNPCERWQEPGRCWICQTRKQPGPRILFQGKSYMKRRARRMIELLNKCAAIFTPSRTLRDIVTKSGIDPEKTVYWPHAIATGDIIRKKPVDAPIHAPIRIGYIGTFASQKGVDLVLDAFQSLRPSNAELHLYGDENQSPEIAARVRAWKSYYTHSGIHFNGRFPLAKLGQIHAGLDLIVAPSTWYENRPLAILEAFSAGNPVLGTDFGGIRELVEPLGGKWRFERCDSKQLANKLAAILSDPEQIKIARCHIPEIMNMTTEIDELEKSYQRYSADSIV